MQIYSGSAFFTLFFEKINPEVNFNPKPLIYTSKLERNQIPRADLQPHLGGCAKPNRQIRSTE
jgi:hypothetical protein